jgi:hypothetical protein
MLFRRFSWVALGPGTPGIYAKRDGANVNLYDDNDCHSSDKFAEIDPTPQTGDYAYYWLTSSKLAVTDGNSSANLKIINFN